MSWFYLFLAGVFEIVWAIALKYSEGFSRPWPTGITIVTGFASFWLLGIAAGKLPIGTAYAIWTGIGAVGTALLGMILFAESHHWLRLASIALIVVGIAGLRLFGTR
jgi:quaternary ammonium compound-resistance protein SugE